MLVQKLPPLDRGANKRAYLHANKPNFWLVIKGRKLEITSRNRVWIVSPIIFSAARRLLIVPQDKVAGTADWRSHNFPVR